MKRPIGIVTSSNLRALALALLAAALAALAALAMATAAFADTPAQAPTYTGTSFTCSASNKCTGSPAEEAMEVNYLAAEEATGDVYVIDSAHDVVNVFDSAGHYLKSLKGSETTAGTFEFEAGGDNAIAVDNTAGSHHGWVYVLGVHNGSNHGVPAGKISAFNAAGAFQWQVSEENEGGLLNEEPCGIAVDPQGHLWTNDFYHGLKQRDPGSGAVLGTGTALGEGGHYCHVSIGPSGRLYAVIWHDALEAFASTASHTESGAVVNAGPAYDVAASHDGIAYAALGATVAAYTFGDSPIGSPVGNLGANYIAAAADTPDGKLYLTNTNTGEIEIWSAAVSGLHTLSVNLGGASGGGEVTSSPAAIACGATCTGEFSENTTVTLTAAPKPGYVLAGWLGGCKPVAADKCEIAMDQAKEVTAVFLKEGTQGSNGSNGGSGTNGKDGAVGPQGPQGKEGPPGKVTCKVKGTKKPKVTCIVKQGASASSARLGWRLMRHGRAYSHGVAEHGRLNLDLSHLRPGYYRLHIQGQKGATSIVVA